MFFLLIQNQGTFTLLLLPFYMSLRAVVNENAIVLQTASGLQTKDCPEDPQERSQEIPCFLIHCLPRMIYNFDV